MRWLAVFALALLIVAPTRSSRGQSGGVTIDLILDEKTYLPGEEIPVGVRVSNLSGRTLTFGSTGNWLTFYAETHDGEIVAQFGRVPVEGPFDLESAKAGTKWWNVQPYFDFQQSGGYDLYAELHLADLGDRVMSDPVTFNIQSARKMWEVSFGVPPADGQPSTHPEVRRYALQSAVRRRDRNLYARVTDETETRIYRVVLLDRLLSFSNPEQQLDNRSRLHVLFQTGGSTYTYSIITPDGELAVRQRHEIVTGSRPRLAKETDGSILVVGGRRSPSNSDIPPYEAAPAEVLAASQPVTVTNAPASTEKDSKSRRRKKSSTTP